MGPADLRSLLEDVVDDGVVFGLLGRGGDEGRIGGGVLRLELLDRVDVAGVGDDGGHAAKLFEKRCHGIAPSLLMLILSSSGSGADFRGRGVARIFTDSTDKSGLERNVLDVLKSVLSVLSVLGLFSLGCEFVFEDAEAVYFYLDAVAGFDGSYSGGGSGGDEVAGFEGHGRR